MTAISSVNSRLALSRLSVRRFSPSTSALSTTRNAVFCASPMPRQKWTASTSAMARDVPRQSPISSPTSSSMVLENAAHEARLILPLAQSHESEFESQRVTKDDSLESLQFAMNAAETLLKATQSTADLAESIRTASIQKQPQIVSIHRTFLAVSQLCVSLMTANNDSNRAFEARSMEHPLLDYTLQLSLKAHNLGLGFHLPLYQKICQAIASQENSIHSPSTWILKVAGWAQLELGHLPTNFFEEPLLELTRRKKNSETVSILQGMQELQHKKSSLNEKTTKEILLNLKGSIRSMYEKQTSSWTLEEEHCREIILLLESSIWKLVDEQQQQHLIERPSILKDAIEVILKHTEQDLSNESCSQQQEDLEDFLLEAAELVELVDAMEGVNHGDVVEGMAAPMDDPSLLLYTRPMECKSIPDITSQLLLGSKTKSLRYSPEMERHIYFQFCPKNKDDDDDDDHVIF